LKALVVKNQFDKVVMIIKNCINLMVLLAATLFFTLILNPDP